MKLVRYGPRGHERPGAIDAAGRVRDLGPTLTRISGSDGDAAAWLAPEALMRLADIDLETLPVAEAARIGCCLADAPNLYGVGVNYENRVAALGLTPPEAPIFFSKATSALAGPADPLAPPPGPLRLDYEVELAAVIGRACYRTPESRALEHVAGYALANDLSARDLQASEGGQWLTGKSMPGFAPLGPWLVTPEEIDNPQALWLSSRVNGAVRQDASTESMLFSVAELISHLSYRLALRPGDVLLTGTPFGTGLDQEPARFLTTGDRVTLGGGQLTGAADGPGGLGEQTLDILAPSDDQPDRI